MRDTCGKMATVTGMITGSALDGTDPRIITVLAIITVVLVILAIGGKE